MGTMKALISYKDWLLLNRGEIRPKVGDEVRMIFEGIDESPTFDKCKYQKGDDINLCYVEIDYNPNEAIEFTMFCGFYGNEEQCKELYKQFKHGH